MSVCVESGRVYKVCSSYFYQYSPNDLENVLHDSFS